MEECFVLIIYRFPVSSVSILQLGQLAAFESKHGAVAAVNEQRPEL
jgi:hypothetical protein